MEKKRAEAKELQNQRIEAMNVAVFVRTCFTAWYRGTKLDERTKRIQAESHLQALGEELQRARHRVWEAAVKRSFRSVLRIIRKHGRLLEHHAIQRLGAFAKFLRARDLEKEVKRQRLLCEHVEDQLEDMQEEVKQQRVGGINVLKRIVTFRLENLFLSCFTTWAAWSGTNFHHRGATEIRKSNEEQLKQRHARHGHKRKNIKKNCVPMLFRVFDTTTYLACFKGWIGVVEQFKAEREVQELSKQIENDDEIQDEIEKDLGVQEQLERDRRGLFNTLNLLHSKPEQALHLFLEAWSHTAKQMRLEAWVERMKSLKHKWMARNFVFIVVWWAKILSRDVFGAWKATAKDREVQDRLATLEANDANVEAQIQRHERSAFAYLWRKVNLERNAVALKVIHTWRMCSAQTTVARAEEGMRKKQKEEKEQASGWYEMSVARSDRFLQAWAGSIEELKRRELFAQCFATWALSTKEGIARALLCAEEDRMLQALQEQRKKQAMVRHVCRTRSCGRRVTTLLRSIVSNSFELWVFGAAIVRYRQRQFNLVRIRINVVERFLLRDAQFVFRHIVVFSWRRIASAGVVGALEEREHEFEEALSSLPSMSSRSQGTLSASNTDAMSSRSASTVLVPSSSSAQAGRDLRDVEPAKGWAGHEMELHPSLREKYDAAQPAGDPQTQPPSPTHFPSGTRLLQQIPERESSSSSSASAAVNLPVESRRVSSTMVVSPLSSHTSSASYLSPAASAMYRRQSASLASMASPAASSRVESATLASVASSNLYDSSFSTSASYKKGNTGMLDLDEFAHKLSKFNFGVI